MFLGDVIEERILLSLYMWHMPT